jgi:hypothetical protein
MLTEEQAANAYEEVTDGCRRLVRVTSDNAPQWQRVKPDEELHPLAELDYEGATRDHHFAARYSSASEYVRVTMIMPSVSNCAAAASMSV